MERSAYTGARLVPCVMHLCCPWEFLPKYREEPGLDGRKNIAWPEGIEVPLVLGVRHALASVDRNGY